MHKYNYAANNPVNITDPGGQFFSFSSVMITIAIIAVLATIAFVSLPYLFAHKDNIYLDFSEMKMTQYDPTFIQNQTVAMVTADYMPYKVTVTTTQPGSSYKHLHIGGTSWWWGEDTFGFAYWNNGYVYTDHMVAYGVSLGASQNDVATAIGNTASHEAGHSFTLGHDSTPHIMQQGWKTDDRTWSDDSKKKLEKVLGLK